ncbi:hypothetical protein ACFLXO_03085 [Chloroflexota bacterium]
MNATLAGNNETVLRHTIYGLLLFHRRGIIGYSHTANCDMATLPRAGTDRQY